MLTSETSDAKIREKFAKVRHDFDKIWKGCWVNSWNLKPTMAVPVPAPTAKPTPELCVFIFYDLPNRDCNAKVVR